jgi:hypothetical protein
MMIRDGRRTMRETTNGSRALRHFFLLSGDDNTTTIKRALFVLFFFLTPLSLLSLNWIWIEEKKKGLLWVLQLLHARASSSKREERRKVMRLSA